MLRRTLPCLALLAATSVSCQKPKSTAQQEMTQPPMLAAELGANQLANAPVGLLASRKSSPIRWQTWEPEVLSRAEDAQRLVLVIVGGTQYPGTVEALDAIDRSPRLVKRLNDEFIPVLVDVDFSRECGLAAGLLSQEQRLPVSFPFLLALSPAGHEVTWRPISYPEADGDFETLFDSATEVIRQMWVSADDRSYVRGNSKRDNANRVQRLAPPGKPAASNERDEFLIRATRQLASQYDPDIGSLSGTGGLLPLGILQCLASASQDPAIPQALAQICGDAVKDFSRHLLQSAMIDPLDGGIYSTRRGNSWNLPMTLRTCMTQARAIRALASLHTATGDPRALEVALGAMRFAEEEYTAGDGLFTNQRQPAATPGKEWLWSVDQINETLSAQETALWRAHSQIVPLGNLEMEADPFREFFRLNTLRAAVPLEKAAATVGVPLAQAPALLESGRKKLLAAREARSPRMDAWPVGTAAPSFRMVSAYSALFTATGDAAWREKALALAKQAREAFSREGRLIEQDVTSPTLAEARAFTYALAIQAALDLAEITLDDLWRLWAGDLSTVVAEKFLDQDGRLQEARPGSTPLQIPIEDRMMLFDDSTCGLMRMNIARLEALGQPPAPEMQTLVRSLPPMADYPVIFTDSILATSFARSRVIVELPAQADETWREAASKLPLDRIARRIGKESGAKIVHPDGTSTPVNSAAELPEAINSHP